MIIVEGMDNSGKTTLVRHLTDKFHLFGVNSRMKMVNQESMETFFRHSMTLQSKISTLIFDRYHLISEPIYGPIIRGNSIISDVALRAMYMVLAMSNAMTIYCRPADDQILQFTEPQMDGVKENAGRLIQAYDDKMLQLQREFGMSVMIYNWTNLEQVEERVYRQIIVCEEQLRKFECFKQNLRSGDLDGLLEAMVK